MDDSDQSVGSEDCSEITSDAESNDSESSIDRFNFREELETCLDEVQTAGSFAIFEPLSSTINPGLHVKGAGTIGLPLSDRDAKAVILASSEASSGNNEPSTDVTMKNVWELSSDCFEVRNPAWQKVITEILEKVGSAMGVTASGGIVKAELRKLVLYNNEAPVSSNQKYYLLPCSNKRIGY